MKSNFMFALAALLAFAPVAAFCAEEKADKEAAAENAGPTDAEKAKAAKLLKATGGKAFLKFAKAKPLAEMGGYPIVVALLPDGKPMSAFMKQKIFTRKEFKELAMNNFVVVTVPLKASKDGKSIDTRMLKEEDAVKFIENFGLSETVVAQAKNAGKPEPKATDMAHYPAVICVDSLCQKLIFRVSPPDGVSMKENPKAVFGIWLSQIADQFRQTGVEPVITPLVQKILDNPTGEKQKK